MARQREPLKPCQRCQQKLAPKGDKYCGKCRSAVIKEMNSSGYLPTATGPSKLCSDQIGRKSVYATKLGGIPEMRTDGDD